MERGLILIAAHAAAKVAILARFADGKREHGMNCGFAWVVIDGRSSMAKYCRKDLGDERTASYDQRRFYGSKSEKGWQWWRPGQWPSLEEVQAVAPDVEVLYEQDMDMIYAGAQAFAKVLQDNGVNAYAACRLD